MGWLTDKKRKMKPEDIETVGTIELPNGKTGVFMIGKGLTDKEDREETERWKRFFKKRGGF